MLSLIIQSGGESTRMGEDKALRKFLNRPLIEHILDRFESVGDERIIITNDPEDYRYLALPLFTDVISGRGALGGLYTALSVANHPYVALVACDMPFASPALILHLYDVLQESGADAVLPSTDHGPEPMHAVYRQDPCRSLVKEAIDQDQWRMISWHKDADVRILSPQETQRHAPGEYTFWNLNTPEEFHEAENVARRLDSY